MPVGPRLQNRYAVLCNGFAKTIGLAVNTHCKFGKFSEGRPHKVFVSESYRSGIAPPLVGDGKQVSAPQLKA